jgi:predicted nucleic acid-binding protein
MSGRVVAIVAQGLLDELAAVLIRPKFRRWLTVALADAAGTAIVTGDADLLDAGIDPPAITPRNLIDALTR